MRKMTTYLIRIFFLSAAMATLLLLFSCSDYLDIKPYGKAIPKTAEEFSALLHGHLDAVDAGEEALIGNISTVCDLECYADNLESILTKYPEGNYIPLYIGSHLSGKQRLYSKLYAIIRDCNIIVDNLEERDSRLARDVLGTSYAMRGVCYYNLLRDFCEPCSGEPDQPGVPLVRHFDMEEKPVRSTYAETAAAIAEDFRTAISYGIEDPVFRFSTDVMLGYLARLHFWIGDYAEAEAYATQVLERHPLLGGSAYKEMMESEIQKKGNILLKSCILTDSDKEIQYSGSKSYTRNRPISRRFISLFGDEKDRDIRYALSIGPGRRFSRSVFACMRSAEMKLIQMESQYHLGKTEEALAGLNELRRLRIEGVADYDLSALPPVNPDEIIRVDAAGRPLTPLLGAILSERRKELFMEGDRWYELKRNGRPEMWTAKQGRKYTTMKFMYTFPLPVTDIALVEGLEQNPGYDKVM